MIPIVTIGKSDRLRQERTTSFKRVVKRVSVDEERLAKNRRIIDNHLRRLGSHFGKELSLSNDGVACLSYKKFIIVLEVPTDNPDTCVIYTMVCQLSKTDNATAVLKKAMQLNYMTYGTRGATLGLEGEEINLCFATSIATLNVDDLRAVLEDFMSTASLMHEHLEKAKTL